MPFVIGDRWWALVFCIQPAETACPSSGLETRPLNLGDVDVGDRRGHLPCAVSLLSQLLLCPRTFDVADRRQTPALRCQPAKPVLLPPETLTQCILLQETGGGHLPCAASLLSQLVACGLSNVDSQIVSLHFVPRLLSACLQYPCANTLQSSTVQLIRYAM